MTTRKTILFKLNNEIVVTDQRTLADEQIEDLKKVIAFEMDCSSDAITVEIEEATRELSDIDSTPDGLVYWNGSYPDPLNGIRLYIEKDVNEFLDAILEGKPEDCLFLIQ